MCISANSFVDLGEFSIDLGEFWSLSRRIMESISANSLVDLGEFSAQARRCLTCRPTRRGKAASHYAEIFAEIFDEKR